MSYNPNSIRTQETYYILEGLLNPKAVNLIAELAELLDESPERVIDLAVQALYEKTLAEGPAETHEQRLKREAPNSPWISPESLDDLINQRGEYAE